jgi:hypothetical protein
MKLMCSCCPVVFLCAQDSRQLLAAALRSNSGSPPILPVLCSHLVSTDTFFPGAQGRPHSTCTVEQKVRILLALFFKIIDLPFLLRVVVPACRAPQPRRPGNPPQLQWRTALRAVLRAGCLFALTFWLISLTRVICIVTSCLFQLLLVLLHVVVLLVSLLEYEHRPAIAMHRHFIDRAARPCARKQPNFHRKTSTN